MSHELRHFYAFRGSEPLGLSKKALGIPGEISGLYETTRLPPSAFDLDVPHRVFVRRTLFTLNEKKQWRGRVP
jgi:hypothetical protein